MKNKFANDKKPQPLALCISYMVCPSIFMLTNYQLKFWERIHVYLKPQRQVTLVVLRLARVKKNYKMEFIKTNHQQVDAAGIHERVNTGQEVSRASRIQRL